MPAPTAKREAGTGRFAKRYPDDGFVTAVEEIGPTGTQSIADRIGCPRDSAYERLMALAEDGVIETDKIGQSRVWSAKETTDKEI